MDKIQIYNYKHISPMLLSIKSIIIAICARIKDERNMNMKSYKFNTINHAMIDKYNVLYKSYEFYI